MSRSHDQQYQTSHALASRGAVEFALPDASIESLQSHVRGDVLQRGDAGYEAARHIYNAMIDKHPRLIVRCADVADVISAVAFGRANGLAVSIRGGGHNVVGFATNDDGLVIDLSRMKGIHVNPEKGTVRVEGGVTWGDLDHATHGFGLAVPGGIVSTTGVIGLTLGGGVGNLTRSFGLSCDNLIAADVVLADGRFVTASAKKNRDLFWALRGGGGNFGVVTSVEFQAHPVETVLGGPIFYPLEQTRDLMRFYRDFVAQAPAELNVYFGLHKAPPAPFIPQHLHDVNVAMLFVNYIGPMKRAEEAMRPIRQFGPPALDLSGPVPFPTIQTVFDEVLHPGLQHYWKAHFVKQLSDEAIEVHARYAATIPNFMSGMHLYPSTGPGQQVSNDATAWSYRDAQFVANIVGVGADREGNAERIRWVREYWEALRPYSEAGTYINFLGDEGEERIRATYRDNYDQLVRLKTKYDPTNLFHMNQNIRPTS